MTLNQLKDIIPNYDIWKNRKSSLIVKYFFNNGLDEKTAASLLDTSNAYLNNKLTRNSFSFNDLIILAAAGKFHFELVSNDETDSLIITPEEWFEYGPIDINARLKMHLIEMQRKHREKYEALQKNIAEMKEKYGFED